MQLKRKLKIFTSVSILTGLTAVAFSGATLADETFTFSHGAATGNGNAWSYTSASGDYAVTATAWADTWEVSGSDKIENAELDHFSGGLGVRNRNGNNEDQGCCEHSMDNRNDYDFILFEFKDAATNANQAVTLSTVDLDWAPYDSDLTVMAFTDPGASSVSPSGLAGVKLSSLTNTNSGWERFDISNAGTSPKSVGAGTTLSSWWIVASSFNGADRDDKVKLAHIAALPGSPPSNGVPLPASIFLMIAGLPLIRRFQRSRNA